MNVVIVYDDFAAGERAVRTLAALRTEAGASAHFSPIPWGFDFLAELPWRTKAIHDVAFADLILFSISRPDEIPAAINHWITKCLHRELHGGIPVIVQLADNEAWSLTPQAQAVAPVDREPTFASLPPSPVESREKAQAHFPFGQLADIPFSRLC